MSGCGRSAWVPLNAALVVMPWATSPTRRAAVTVGGNELAHRATVLWAQLAPGKDGTRPSFLRVTASFGAPIAAGLCCGRRRRIACPGEEWTCAVLLPEVDPTARDCVGEPWKDTVLRSVTSTSDGNEMNLRISAQRALLVKKTGIICRALEVPVAGWAGGVGQAVSVGMVVHRMVKGTECP
ncbi:hypothetical protein TcBrA4_0093660 [Trypanosoma cruzi]|nr:hypothetical protein TcBrA4_0093660 [Trypanosoma cruzi]